LEGFDIEGDCGGLVFSMAAGPTHTVSQIGEHEARIVKAGARVLWVAFENIISLLMFGVSRGMESQVYFRIPRYAL